MSFPTPTATNYYFTLNLKTHQKTTMETGLLELTPNHHLIRSKTNALIPTNYCFTPNPKSRRRTLRQGRFLEITFLSWKSRIHESSVRSRFDQATAGPLADETKFYQQCKRVCTFLPRERRYCGISRKRALYTDSEKEHLIHKPVVDDQETLNTNTLSQLIDVVVSLELSASRLITSTTRDNTSDTQPDREQYTITDHGNEATTKLHLLNGGSIDPQSILT